MSMPWLTGSLSDEHLGEFLKFCYFKQYRVDYPCMLFFVHTRKHFSGISTQESALWVGGQYIFNFLTATLPSTKLVSV